MYLTTFETAYFGGNRDQHMHVIGHNMPFLNSTLLLFRQTPEHIAETCSYLPEDRLLAVFRGENKVILTLPTTMT